MARTTKDKIDPLYLTQRVLKYVLVPAAIAGGAWQVVQQRDDIGSVVRLAIAAGLGGLLGVERTLSGHWAGLRTHMMVALGSAVFTLVASKHGTDGDATRVIQGIAAGIGFLGAGTILKLSDRREVVGLTTASSIWLTAAIGTGVGLGLYTISIAATVLSLVVLAVMLPLERQFLDEHIGKDEHDRTPSA